MSPPPKRRTTGPERGSAPPAKTEDENALGVPQLDLRLQLVFDRGPEADLLPGKRIDPAVHRHSE